MREGKNEKEMKEKGRKDNAFTIKLSRLTPRIKRPQRTLGSVTKLLEYFAPLKCERIEVDRMCVCVFLSVCVRVEGSGIRLTTARIP